MPKVIDEFRGKHFFLSNFYPTIVYFEGFAYPSSEHAYVASKTSDETTRRVIAKISTAAEAKNYGYRIRLRDNFDSMKLALMYEIVHSKFSRDVYLKQELLNTNDATLIEGNTWGDTYWGICDGLGDNHLGKILMKVREEINA